MISISKQSPCEGGHDCSMSQLAQWGPGSWLALWLVVQAVGVRVVIQGLQGLT